MSRTRHIPPHDFTTLLYDVSDRVAWLTLNRPDRRNALDTRAYLELEGAFAAVAGDPDIRCVVITGADPAFCAGDDVRALMAATPAEALAERQIILDLPPRTPQIDGVATPAAMAILACDRPVIAAVNGAAVGWGMELALLADIRIASDLARFGDIFVKRGLIPDLASFCRLPALVGPARAAELMFTGEVISADEALRIGLVSRCTPHGDLLAEARRLAAAIAANPPLALRHIKMGLARWSYGDPAQTGAWTNRVLDDLRATEDHREGVASFLERREPVFKGR